MNGAELEARCRSRGAVDGTAEVMVAGRGGGRSVPLCPLSSSEALRLFDVGLDGPEVRGRPNARPVAATPTVLDAMSYTEGRETVSRGSRAGRSRQQRVGIGVQRGLCGKLLPGGRAQLACETCPCFEVERGSTHAGNGVHLGRRAPPRPHRSSATKGSGRVVAFEACRVMRRGVRQVGRAREGGGSRNGFTNNKTREPRGLSETGRCGHKQRAPRRWTMGRKRLPVSRGRSEAPQLGGSGRAASVGIRRRLAEQLVQARAHLAVAGLALLVQRSRHAVALSLLQNMGLARHASAGQHGQQGRQFHHATAPA